MAKTMKAKTLRRLMNIWPPYWGAGIHVKELSDDFTSATVELKPRFYNRNYVGTHFGGSLYAMTDPFYMLMLLHRLGNDYIVWDKAADIRFKKPGRGLLTAHFNLSQEQVDEIKAQADRDYKAEPHFTVQVMDEDGDVVAEVDKVVYVRRKDRQKNAGLAPKT